MIDRILEYAKAEEASTIEYRRRLHMRPELSNEEEETVGFIRKMLDGWGIPYVEIPQGGILGHISGKCEDQRVNQAGTEYGTSAGCTGQSVLLRADMDALPVQESESNLKLRRCCISERSGIMHACGHDAHTAMLLSAAKIINEHRDELNGNVWLMFERGEEGNCRNFEHFYEYIDANKIKIDRCYASHVYPGIESGQVGICNGPTMAGRIYFKVTVIGKGGHGSRPEECINPMACFTKIYDRLEELAKNYEPFAYSIGMVKAGESENIIPSELFFSGTARAFDYARGEDFRARFLDILDEETERTGTRYEAFISHLSPAINNDPEAAGRFREKLARAVGNEHVMIPKRPWMASESFALTMARWPGLYAFVGCGNEEKGCGAPNHSPFFDIDEAGLVYGVAAYVVAVWGDANCGS